MSVSETKVTKMWILLGPGVKECRSILQSDFFGNFDNSFHRHSSLDWRLCRVMPEAVWPDFEIKYFFKSCHKSNHRSVHPQRVIFRNSLKVVKNIWKPKERNRGCFAQSGHTDYKCCICDVTSIPVSVRCHHYQDEWHHKYCIVG